MNFTPHKSTDLLPEFRTKFDPQLQEFVEGFLTDDRKIVLREMLALRSQRITMVAESLLDEHNINAIIRSSECFGLQDFHYIPYKEAILKQNKSVTRGAYQWTHIYDYTEAEDSTTACISHLKSQGFKVYATSSNIETKLTPFNLPIHQPIAIIMGNEHRGVSEIALSQCDGVIKIPMYGFTESFNVSVAASLLLQPIVERIRSSDIDWRLSQEDQDLLYYEWIWYRLRNPDNIYKQWLVNNSSE